MVKTNKMHLRKDFINYKYMSLASLLFGWLSLAPRCSLEGSSHRLSIPVTPMKHSQVRGSHPLRSTVVTCTAHTGFLNLFQSCWSPAKLGWIGCRAGGKQRVLFLGVWGTWVLSRGTTESSEVSPELTLLSAWSVKSEHSAHPSTTTGVPFCLPHCLTSTKEARHVGRRPVSKSWPF